MKIHNFGKDYKIIYNILHYAELYNQNNAG